MAVAAILGVETDDVIGISFLTADDPAKTVTVVDGIITSIG